MAEPRKRTGRKPKDLTRKRIYAGLTRAEAEEAEAEHRRIMAVLTGLLLTQFVGMMANTIVGNAMPVIAAEVGARPSQYTWIITSAILANTVLTPIAGKLGDLFDKRLMLTIFISIFMLGSLLSGLAMSAEMLIAVRVLQGIGMGGQVMMSIVIMATIIPPRKRGRYNGYQGAVMAVATVSGPFIGGVIVDTPWLGWRWCFFLAIPFMAFAARVVWTRLELPPTPRRKVHIDYLGALLVAAATSLLLVWISTAGNAFPWASTTSYLMAGGAVLLAVLFLLVESRVKEPLIPLHILGSRTTLAAIVASVGIGAMMFGSNVFLGQYFQYGREFSPAIAGFLGLPMMFGLLIASTWSGRVVTRRGTWKGVVVWGMSLMTLGTALFGALVHQDTSLWLTSLFLLVAGWGMGMCMQNLVLAVQNTVGLRNMGAATSSVTFFRNLGGTIAIQALGILYAQRVASHIRGSAISVPGGAASESSLDFEAMPDAVEEVVRTGYAEGIGPVFLTAAAIGAVGLVAVLFMRGTSLRDTVDTPVTLGDAGPGEAGRGQEAGEVLAVEPGRARVDGPADAGPDVGRAPGADPAGPREPGRTSAKGAGPADAGPDVGRAPGADPAGADDAGEPEDRAESADPAGPEDPEDPESVLSGSTGRHRPTR